MVIEERLILVFVVLGIAVLFDLWKRQVPDILWVAGGIGAVVLYVVSPWEIENIHGFVVIPFAILLWRKGVFGGADAFAISFISLVVPMFSYHEMRMTPFSILINSGLVLLPWIVSNIVRNVIQYKKNGSLFTQQDNAITKIRKITLAHMSSHAKKSYILGSDARYKRIHNESLIEDQELDKQYWVTPAIPFLLIITIGFGLQVFLGDIVLRLFSS